MKVLPAREQDRAGQGSTELQELRRPGGGLYQPIRDYAHCSIRNDGAKK